MTYGVKGRWAVGWSAPECRYSTTSLLVELVSWPVALALMLIFATYAMLNVAATLEWAIWGFRLVFGVTP